MPNPSKILGHVWTKDDDTLELLAKPFPQEHPVTKRTILSYLGTVYDPLGIILPTMAEGKYIYWEACDEKKGWNAEVSPRLKDQWLRWTKQLKDVRVPRSIASFVGEIRAVHLHLFADASILACCAAAVEVVEHEAGVTKGLLTSKSRISKRSTSIARLELVSKTTNSLVLGRTLKQATSKHFSFSFWTWIWLVGIQLKESSPTFDIESE